MIGLLVFWVFSPHRVLADVKIAHSALEESIEDSDRDTPQQGVRGNHDASLSSVLAMNRSGVQEVALIAGDLGFFPKVIFVTRNIPVKLFITGVSKKPLCIMLDSFQIRKQLHSQKIEEIDFLPTDPGKYRFYCPINQMEGTLFVKDASFR